MRKIINNTNSDGVIIVKPRGSTIEYEIIVKAHSYTELDDSLILLKNRITNEVTPKILTEELSKSTIEITEDPVINEEAPKYPDDEAPMYQHTPIVEENKPTEPDDYICSICGSQFASARGLNMHMKSHKE